ncbi:hypothetical protein DPMN_108885 [Dreissena polymorpha]|uniref:Uncharacterized protein n=1 Tax=Dreissena polymorpha TaxID=45954 RepID=A0A9D4QMG0_DREPO|nr:hypothetical protein DPMN_108885 [Dreissena polymorpha]
MVTVVHMATYRVQMDRMVPRATKFQWQQPLSSNGHSGRYGNIQSADGQNVPNGHIIQMVTVVNIETYRVQMDRMVTRVTEFQWPQWSIWQHTECRWTEWSQKPLSSNGHSGRYGNIQSADGQNGPRVPMVTMVHMASMQSTDLGNGPKGKLGRFNKNVCPGNRQNVK